MPANLCPGGEEWRGCELVPPPAASGLHVPGSPFQASEAFLAVTFREWCHFFDIFKNFCDSLASLLHQEGGHALGGAPQGSSHNTKPAGV